MKTNLLLAALILVGSSAFAAEPTPAKPAKKPAAQPDVRPPTMADVAYGKHPKQVLHFWKAKADKPTPLLFFVHGGGWMNGNRLSGLAPMLDSFLDAGISVVSVEYRFIPEATADG